jgi:hypothetical protein
MEFNPEGMAGISFTLTFPRVSPENLRLVMTFPVVSELISGATH